MPAGKTGLIAAYLVCMWIPGFMIEALWEREKPCLQTVMNLLFMPALVTAWEAYFYGLENACTVLRPLQWCEACYEAIPLGNSRNDNSEHPSQSKPVYKCF